MNAVNGNPTQETFIRILQKLGKMGDYYTLANELSQDSSGGYVRLFRWLMTQPNYAGLRHRIVNQQFFLLITRLANLEQQHEEEGLPAATSPSAQVTRLLDDPQLMSLLPPLSGEGDLRELLLRLSSIEATQLVQKMVNDGLYRVAEKFAALPDDDPLIGHLADDTTPFFAIVQLLASHPEMDGLLAAILKQLANDPVAHVLPEEDDFARLVIDLSESHAVQDPRRRSEFFDLARGFATEPDSLDLARKILFNARFPQVAARLADDTELTNVVRRMLDDEHFKKIAEMLKGSDASRLLISVAEKPEYAETLRRLESDKSFAELVNELRTDGSFFEQIKHMSKDEVLKSLDGALAKRPLNAATIAEQLCNLGEQLSTQGNADEAITTYMLSLRLDPSLRKAYLGHAQACQSKGYYTQSVEDYRTLIEKNNQDTEACLKLGQVHLLMNMLDEAEQYFRNVLELSTDQDERQQADDGLYKIARRQE